jgi:urea transport system substrate-binding protein
MRTDSACPSSGVLADLLANALPAAEADRVRGHLAGCPDCQARVRRDPIPTRADVGATRHPGRQPSGAAFPFLAPPQEEGELGRLGDFRVLGLLGEGGMGYVFDAEDTVLRRRVALKVLKPELADDAMRKRFLREARVAAGLPHDHIAAVFQVGQTEVPGEGEVPYLAMERLHGESLEDRLQRDQWLPLEEDLRIARETAEGLVAAHEKGLIHRDIKPANIWLETPSGARASSARYRVKILDFGLARAQDGSVSLTTDGQVVGTPSYMSPEQAGGKAVDTRADLYSLGCVLYRMVSGVAPFADLTNDTNALLQALARWQPRPVSEVAPQTPPAVAHLIDQLLARNPADRPPTAHAVVERLRALEDSLPAGASDSAISGPPSAVVPPSRRRYGLAVWAGALMVFVALVVVLVVGYKKMFDPPSPNLHGDKNGRAGEPAGEPIKVGILHSVTGTLAFTERPIIDATKFAIDEINRSGGVLGRRIEAITADGKSEAEVFAAQARKLIDEHQVVTIFGCWSSASRKRVEPVCARYDRLLLYPASFEGLEEARHVFYLGGAPNQVLLPVARWAHDQEHKKRFFLIGSESLYSRASHAILSDELKRLGAEVVGDTYTPLGKTKFSAVVRAVQAAKPNMILNTLSGQSNLSLLEALREEGVQPDALPTVWFNVSEHELHYLGEKRMIGDYSAASYFQSVDRPANKAFVARFQKHFGETRTVNDAMQTAYFGVYLWKKAVEQAKGTDTDRLRSALKEQQIEAPEGPMRIDAPTQYTWRMARIGRVVAGGQFKVVWQSPEALQPMPYPDTRTRAEWQMFLTALYRRWGGHWEKHAH